MTTLFTCAFFRIILSSVHRWRAPTRLKSSVPSWTDLGAEARPPRLPLYPALVLAFLLAGPVSAGASEPLRLVAMGDVPYQLPDDLNRLDRLIQAINQAAPDLALHIGDIKSGSTPCIDAAYRRVRDRFAAVNAPLLYTPGDNEWTDCHRDAAGGLDPLERLAALRALFFAEPRSLGGHPIDLTRQSDGGDRAPYPENARITLGAVTVVTAHVVGSNNNLRQGHPAAIAEYRARDRASAAWIRAGFDAAKRGRSKAVIVAMHADPFDRGNGLPGPTNRSGFAGTLSAIADGAAAYGGPVLVIHGDSHAYRVDQPFRTDAGERLPNVTRLEVFGAPTVAAVLVTVTPDADEPFRFVPLKAPEPASGGDQR